MQENERTVVVADAAALGSPASRRKFLRALGLGGTVVLLPSAFAACDDSFGSTAATEVIDAYNTARTVTIDLSTDAGIFNFALVLEQLEQAYYNQFLASSQFEALFPAVADREALNDIRNDENVHRLFIQQALGPAAIPQLAFDFKDAFASRANFLTNARAFSNTGVAAYNGSGRYIKDVNNLLVAGKIVSVEGRHAATLNDLDDAANQTGAGEATGRRFADLTLPLLAGLGANDAGALDVALPPAQVVPIADPFVVTPLNVLNAPAAL